VTAPAVTLAEVRAARSRIDNLVDNFASRIAFLDVVMGRLEDAIEACDWKAVELQRKALRRAINQLRGVVR